MFDPGHLGQLPVSLIEKVFLSRPSNKSHYIMMKLQKKQHIFVIEENKSGSADKMVADRLKYIFDLAPVHTIMAQFGMSISFREDNYNIVMTNPKEYILYAAPMRRDENEQILFVKEPCLNDILKRVDLMNDKNFKKEVIKIFLFRFLIGASNSTMKTIRVRTNFSYDNLNGEKHETYIPVAFNEEKVGRQNIPNAKLNKREWEMVFGDKYQVDKVRKNMVETFDHDNMRGILLQTRKPEEDIKNRRPKKALSIPAYKLATMIEKRIEIMSSVNIDTFVREYLGGNLLDK